MSRYEPTRLTIARQRRKLTQKSLADIIGVTPQYISSIERGESEPTDTTANQIASVLGFPPSFFYMPEVEIAQQKSPTFRSRRSMTALVRNAATSLGTIGSQIISPYFSRQFRMPPSDIPDLSEHNVEDAAEILRARWNLGNEPIKNTVHLVESKGVEVYWLNEDSPSLDAFTLWYGEKPYMFLNIHKGSAERSRLDVAHELAHLVLHRHVDDDQIDSREIEAQAYEFARFFLLPAEQFVRLCPRQPVLEDLLELKHHTGVSVIAMVKHAHELGIYSEWQTRTAYIEINRRGWHRNEPQKLQREQSHLHRILLTKLAEKGKLASTIAQETNITLNELNELIPLASGNASAGIKRGLDSDARERLKQNLLSRSLNISIDVQEPKALRYNSRGS